MDWDGPGGVSPRFIRADIYNSITGDDTERRRLASATLSAMNLRGLLLAARDAGVRCAHVIAEDVGPGMGWPIAAARRYLTSRLSFTLTERHLEGMRRFIELARQCDLVPPSDVEVTVA